MAEHDELFPQTPVEKLRTIRKWLIAENEKADEALERAEAKVSACRQRLYMMNEAIEAAEKAEKAAAGILTYEVDLNGEVQG